MNYFVVAFLSAIAALGLFSIIGAILKAIGVITISWWWIAVPAVVFCIVAAGLAYILIDSLKYVG